MDTVRFNQSLAKVFASPKVQSGVGTLSEKTLHAVLKDYFCPYSDSQEVNVGEFIADIVNETGIVEIQTKRLAGLAKKLDVFLPCCPVTVVHPVITERTIVRIDPASGEIISRRKSPKKLQLIDVFSELYGLRNYIALENFTFCVCLLKADVIKNTETKRYAVKKLNTVPTELVDEIYFSSPEDYKRFIPGGLPEVFTSAQFAAAAKTSSKTALSCLNTLTAAGLIQRVGKRANAILFSATM